MITAFAMSTKKAATRGGMMKALGAGPCFLATAVMLAIAGGLMIFILLTGPTAFLMGGIVQAAGEYVTGAFAHGFRTFTFLDERVGNWFQAWTLTYMVWWLAWAPFVGVFIGLLVWLYFKPVRDDGGKPTEPAETADLE